MEGRGHPAAAEREDARPRRSPRCVELAEPKVVITVRCRPLPGPATVDPAARPDDPDRPLPDVVSPAWKAPTSGGSTGRPKLIVAGDAAELDPEARPCRPPSAIPAEGCLVMPGPLYHNGPLDLVVPASLLSGGHVVLLERFDAEATLAAIQDHRADVVYLVPTMMKRIWRLPEEVRDVLRPVAACSSCGTSPSRAPRG